MIKFIIAGAVIIAFACIVLLVLYHFGFIDFYHPMNTATEHQIKVA